ncbi:MAG: hypothetical protein ACKPCM_09280, partial [Pseudanabaena sp.]
EVLRSQIDDISPELLAAAYPLHPIAALVLPILCTRYAQNDRSLFTFLTSAEPYGLQSYLKEFNFDGDRIPLLKLDRIYDYFIESAGMGLANRPQLQKWVEIQNLVSDASNLDTERVKLLKTVGILNLITSTGGLKASRGIVKWALCDRPDDQSQQAAIDKLIDEFLDQKGILHHRKQIDELRIWEGSDFDVESAIATHIEQERSPLAQILTSISKLKPVVAQRHSYITGTTRYFERVYLDHEMLTSQPLTANSQLRCSHYSFDGMIGYWVSAEPPQSLPSITSDGKPLIVVMAANLKFLHMAALEYTALQKIQNQAKGLDRVATLEVRHRLIQAKRIFDEDLGKSFAMNQQQNGCGNVCWIEGERIEISRAIDFNSK